MQLIVTYIYPYQDEGDLFLLQDQMEEILRMWVAGRVSNEVAYTIKRYKARIYPIERPGGGKLCLEMTFLHNLPEKSLKDLILDLNGLVNWLRVGSRQEVYIVIGAVETI